MKPKVVQDIVKENERVYNSIAQQFSQTRHHPWAEFDLFRPHVEQGDRVLDIGCGNGRLARFFRDKKISYTGVDSSPKLIELARKQNPESRFIVSDASALPLPDQQFTIIFLIATLHHIPSHPLRLRVIKEAYRVLQPGGKIIMTEWNLLSRQWWPMLFKSALKKIFLRTGLDWGDIRKPWKDSSGKVKGYRYLHPFTRGSLTRLLSEAGFTDIQHQITKKGRRASWYKGYNIITIARRR